MLVAPLPPNEDERLRVLKNLQILDTLEERQFDALTSLAARVCETPVALVSLVDCQRQWFKSVVGLPPGTKETPRDVAFCAHAILGDDVFLVEDAAMDTRFADNPLVTSEPPVRFYAGVPLKVSGMRVGTLCVISPKPRRLPPERRELLIELARQAEVLLEERRLRLELQVLQRQMAQEFELGLTVLRSVTNREEPMPSGVHAVVRSATTFCGDFARAATGRDGVLRAILADVTGHGLSAALCHFPAHEVFQRWLDAEIPLEDAAWEINRAMRPLLETGRFMAAVLVEVHRASHTVRLWSGGMPEGWYFSTPGEPPQLLAAAHPALGVVPDEHFDNTIHEISHARGQLIFVSDGLEEAANADGEMLGLHSLLAAATDAAPHERIAKLLGLVDQHADGCPITDDVAILAFDLSATMGE